MLSNAYFLQNFVLIQPRTSPLKICKIFQNLLILLTPERGPAERARASSGGGPWASRGARRDCVSCAKCCFSRWPANLAALNRVRVSKFGKISKIFANFWRARSRLYQNEIWQENMRLTAFFKLYKICILLHRCNLKILAENRFEKSTIFVRIDSAIFCKCCKICKILPDFKIFS